MSTGFNVYGQQPDANNPLGNPPYPGATAANGPVFIDFLTTTYNRSFLETYNLAFGGAMIDNAVVASPFGLQVKSFSDQVNELFLPHYVSNPGIPWVSNDTLFVVFMGINDAINTFMLPDTDGLQYRQVVEYERIVDQLYNAGARNFLFGHIPPIDRAPYMFPFSQSQRNDLARWIASYIFRLHSLIWNFTRRYADVTAFEFDTNSLFLRVLADPSQFPETSGCRVVTDFCLAYER